MDCLRCFGGCVTFFFCFFGACLSFFGGLFTVGLRFLGAFTWFV